MWNFSEQEKDRKRLKKYSVPIALGPRESVARQLYLMYTLWVVLAVAGTLMPATAPNRQSPSG